MILHHCNSQSQWNEGENSCCQEINSASNTNTYTHRHTHSEGLAVVQVTAWVLLVRNCTVLPWPQPRFFSDPIRSEIRKHIPLKGTCLLYIWKISGDGGREESTLDTFSKIRCSGNHQWSPQWVKDKLASSHICSKGSVDWGGERMFFPPLCLHTPQRCPTLKAECYQAGPPASVAEGKIWSCDVTTSTRKASFRSVFSCFLCFSSKIFFPNGL